MFPISWLLAKHVSKIIDLDYSLSMICTPLDGPYTLGLAHTLAQTTLGSLTDYYRLNNRTYCAYTDMFNPTYYTIVDTTFLVNLGTYLFCYSQILSLQIIH
jgi:hypothetical protein